MSKEYYGFINKIYLDNILHECLKKQGNLM